MPSPVIGPVRRLLLVRHGLTSWNAERRWQGSRDIELCDEGRAQAHALRARLLDTGLRSAFSSDLARARETARIATPDGVPLSEEPLLREMSYGTWEGVSDPEVEARWPYERRRWREAPHESRPGGGESIAEVEERAWRGLTACLDRSEGDVLVVAHGGVNRVLLGRILELPPSRFGSLQQSPTGVTILELPAAGEASIALRRARLLLFNCTRHVTHPKT